MPVRYLILCTIVLCSLPGCLIRRGGTAGVKQEISRGDRARYRHRLRSARGHYEQAEADAALLGAGALEAEAALKSVRVIEIQSSVSELEKGALPGLETADGRRQAMRAAYERVIAVGGPQQQALARNNLAVMLLQAGRDDEARDILRAIPGVGAPPDTRLPEADLSVYVFNYARTLEHTSDYEGAYAQCARTVRLRPRFRPCVRKAFRLLEVFRPARVLDAIDLLELIVTKGWPRQADRFVRELLHTWSDEPAAVALLPLAARAWLASGQDCRAFDEATWRGLGGGGMALRPAITELEAACSGDLAPALSSPLVIRLFPIWTGRGWTSPLSQLLTAVGEEYLHEEGGVPQALARYVCASRLDPANMRARLYAVSLLQADPDLDPGGRIVRTLLPPATPPGHGADLQDEIRTRVMLGRIFEREGRLGPPEEGDTAIFQWRRVLESETGSGEGHPRSPETYFRLGTAYRGVGDTDHARAAYLEALEAFDRCGNGPGAARAKEELDALGARQHDGMQ